MSESLERRSFSVVILAGGESRRMGKDKAFLLYKGKRFVEIITESALRVSDDVMVVIGSKQESDFDWLATKQGVLLLSDKYHLKNPIGGILTAVEQAKHPYTAILPCDSPLVTPSVISFLFTRAQSHSGAVPEWENGNTEPLCAVYSSAEIKEAITKALAQNKLGPKHAISFLKDVQYVPVEELRKYDNSLNSLLNVNTMEDYNSLP